MYNNQPIQVLKKAAADSIKEGEVGRGRGQEGRGRGSAATVPLEPQSLLCSPQAVWFGCDVGKHFHSKLGINDMNV